ncbi:MAG: PAS domain S-box protein [Chloroflexi bacterium]|nr:PAS domain S-box protein [Chloroflexota bacterium]
MFLLPDYRVRQRDHLLEISRAITGQLDLREVLRMVLGAAISMLAGEVGMIALRDGDRFVTSAVLGLPADQMDVFDPLLEELSADTVEHFDASVLYAKMRRVARHMDLNLRQVVALPMEFAGDLLGILFIFRSYAGAATDNDHRLLQSFADQAAIAVHNARLYRFANHERQRLAAILDHSADGVMILDTDLAVESWNRALARMTGLPAEQATGRHHDVVIRWVHRQMGPDVVDMVGQGWPGMVPVGTPDTLYAEGDIERLDGSLLSVGITYAPLLLPDGTLQNVIANVRDITHFREAEQLKSTFISVISHELKTPVALIKGYADTLNRQDAHWDGTTIRNGLAVIEEEADRLAELIENLLAASKLQAEGMQLSLDDANLPMIADQAIDRFQTQTDCHTLRAEFPERFPIICGDATRLRQVLDNLLSNAIKYSPDGGEVVVRGSFDDEWVRVEVIDQGPGIPVDQLDRIFERFHRIDNALTSNAQGTGLGLYLAHAVVTAHDGRIWASNNPDQGATITFVLPRQD